MNSRCRRIVNILLNEIDKYPVEWAEQPYDHDILAWTTHHKITLSFRLRDSDYSFGIAVFPFQEETPYKSILPLDTSVMPYEKATEWMFRKALEVLGQQPYALVALSTVLACLSEGQRTLISY